MFHAFVQSTQHTKQMLTQNKKKNNEKCPANLKEQAKQVSLEWADHGDTRELEYPQADI